MAGLNWQRLSVLACAVALSPVTALLAQEASTGIVRISDRGGVRNVNHNHAGTVTPVGGQSNGGYVSGSYGGDCPTGDCYGGKHGSGSFKEKYCTHSPDHGFSVPGKWPIHRRGVQYTNYYPAQWGAPDASVPVPNYPMVYMPTDTTQLGFYSQHVPFWQPQPNPLPRRPIPAQWHNYAPVVHASDWGNSYYKGGYGANCPVDGTVVQQGSPTPIQQPAAQPAQPAAPQPPVDAPRPLPPAPEGI